MHQNNVCAKWWKTDQSAFISPRPSPSDDFRKNIWIIYYDIIQFLVTGYQIAIHSTLMSFSDYLYLYDEITSSGPFTSSLPTTLRS